jgi:hypothetical protein
MSFTNFVHILSPFANELIKHNLREARDAMHEIKIRVLQKVLDIPQMVSRPCRGSHDWVQKTPRSFEIIILEFSVSTEYKLNFRQVQAQDKKVCTFGTRGTHLFKVSS